MNFWNKSFAFSTSSFTSNPLVTVGAVTVSFAGSSATGLEASAEDGASSSSTEGSGVPDGCTSSFTVSSVTSGDCSSSFSTNSSLVECSSILLIIIPFLYLILAKKNIFVNFHHIFTHYFNFQVTFLDLANERVEKEPLVTVL